MDQSQQQARPRAKSTLSFNSNKSRDAPSSPKHERKISESERRKTHYDPNTKANPNAAMNEIQPSTRLILCCVDSLITDDAQSLPRSRSLHYSRSVPFSTKILLAMTLVRRACSVLASVWTLADQHLSVDPDLSNPTRSRWERPLDTIRSFEAAIDGEYKRRAQSMRADQTDIMSGYNSRRSSYYGGGGHDQNRFSQVSGYYGNRQPMRDSYDNGHNMGGPVGGPQRMRHGTNRMQSDPGWNNRQSTSNVYPMNGYQQSRDTINTNGSNGSHSDGPYSNEPSSENSSIERGAGPVRPPQDANYGYNGYNNGYNNGPIREEYGQGPTNGYFPPQNNGVPPPVPKHATPPAPIKLGGGAVGSPTNGGRPAVLSKNSSNGGDDKRKSWFKRRFSKD